MVLSVLCWGCNAGAKGLPEDPCHCTESGAECCRKGDRSGACTIAASRRPATEEEVTACFAVQPGDASMEALDICGDGSRKGLNGA